MVNILSILRRSYLRSEYMLGFGLGHGFREPYYFEPIILALQLLLEP